MNLNFDFFNFKVTIYLSTSEEIVESGYADKDMKIDGMCSKLDILEYLLVFNIDHQITKELVLHEVYHLFFEVLNDISRNVEFAAKELGKDLYCYMFTSLFTKVWRVIQEELNKDKDNNELQKKRKKKS